MVQYETHRGFMRRSVEERQFSKSVTRHQHTSLLAILLRFHQTREHDVKGTAWQLV